MCVARDDPLLDAKLSLGSYRRNYTEVTDGVSAGDRVVVHPPDMVAEGVKIRARLPDGS